MLFDVDGTIIDTEYVMTHSLQKTLQIIRKKRINSYQNGGEFPLISG